MARQTNRLTVRGIAAENRPGMYSDGGSLYLAVARGGSKVVMRAEETGRMRTKLTTNPIMSRFERRVEGPETGFAWSLIRVEKDCLGRRRFVLRVR